MWQTMLMSMATGVIKMAMPFITKELRRLMEKSLNEWEEYAKRTPYNWDNLLVGAIKSILCVSEDEKPEKPLVVG
jgi:hypothetical protein